MRDYCIVIITLSDKKEIINNISKELLQKRLVAGSQISEVESSYWWNNKINKAVEYKLEVRTMFSLYDKIEKLIKKLHNYELPEISYYELNGSVEIKDWIKENVSKV